MINETKSIINGILYLYLFVLNITGSHLTLNVTKLEKNVNQSNRCEDWQFQCKNGQCIAKTFICDGYTDCDDASDEIRHQCQKKSLKKCEKEEFQCLYGACIEIKYKCDGIKQCADGSDESSCATLLDYFPMWCPAPELSADKAVHFVCGGDPSNTCDPLNGSFPPYTIATITCAADYYRENGDSSSAHTCYKNDWSPRITRCSKKCDKLNPTNVILKCYRDRVRIDDCDINSILLAGTKVRPTCKTAHKYDSPPSYFEITCDEDGRWNNILIPCVPECGKPFTSAKALVSGGTPEKIGGSPWHVAIFDKEKTLICGGTIITEKLVISAAHCFSEGKNCEGTECADDFEVVVGKYTNNYTARDNDYQKIMKIKEIRFPEEGYHGIQNYHASDLAILILRRHILISPAVMPACINWMDLIHRKYPKDGEPGKVVGWGRTENDTLSTILRTVTLPFISYKNCIDIVDRDFQPFVTVDKICAGTGNRTGATLMDGDSGGGLLFEDRGLYYLRGVVSVKQYASNAATIFTDLTNHVEWIESVRENVTPKKHQNQMEPNNALDQEVIRQDIPDRSEVILTVRDGNCDLLTQRKKEQEEAQRKSLAVIINDLKHYHFFAAEQRLAQWDPNTSCYHVVHEIYNNQPDNFDLLLNFGDSITNIERKFKIYQFLYNETATGGFNDTQRLFRFSQSVKKSVLDRLAGFLPAEQLYQQLYNATTTAASGLISSAFQNDNLLSMVREIGTEICSQSQECLFKIYNSVVETVWDKITMESFLNKSYNLKYIGEVMIIHIVVTDKLEHTDPLDKNLTKTLVSHMTQIENFSTYNGVNKDLRSRHQKAKNKLLATQQETNRELFTEVQDIKSRRFPAAEEKLLGTDPSVTKEGILDPTLGTPEVKAKSQEVPKDILAQLPISMNNESNIMKTKVEEQANLRLPAEIEDDIRSQRFTSAEQKLSLIDDNTYYNILHEFYHKQYDSFDLLLNFGASIADMGNKFKLYEALYNETATSGLPDLQKLLRLSQSIKKEILDRMKETVAPKAQTFYQTLKSAIIMDANIHISSAFLNNNSWPMVNELSRNITSNCSDCTHHLIYKSVVETVWDVVPLEDLLRRAEKNLDLTQVIAVQVAVADKLEHIGKLHNSSSITLARYMKSTMDLPNYKKVNSDDLYQHEKARNKLPRSLKNLIFSSAI